MGANGGFILFGSAREAASHARWGAKAKGGTIRVYDAEGNLFKTIEIDPDTDKNEAYVLSSVFSTFSMFAAVGSLIMDGLKKLWRKLAK